MAGWQNKPILVKLNPGESAMICTCGHSQNAPFCDGSHSGSGMNPQEIPSKDKPQVISVCACLLSKRGILCDGSHIHADKKS